MRIIRITLSVILLSIWCFTKAQSLNPSWYSESSNDGIIIQNSYPKGGPYTGSTNRHYNHSYLVFYTRVINETGKPFELELNFPADSIAIPSSPNTYVKLFLPSETMTLDKRSLFSYGLTELESLEEPSNFKRKLAPKEDCLFYVVAVFFQTKDDKWNHERGGNRAELVLKGQDLFYRMLPQVDLLSCGQIGFDE